MAEITKDSEDHNKKRDERALKRYAPVFELLCDGYTYYETAEKLYLHPSTVQYARKRYMDKWLKENHKTYKTSEKRIDYTKMQELIKQGYKRYEIAKMCNCSPYSVSTFKRKLKNEIH